MLNSKQTDKILSTEEELAKLKGDSDYPVTITEAEVQNLDTMTIDQLKTLVRRLVCQCGLAATMSKEETAQAMRDVLAETALRSIVPGLNMKADIKARMEAIDKWLDRNEGKPHQAVEVTTKIGIIDLVLECNRIEKENMLDVTPNL